MIRTHCPEFDNLFDWQKLYSINPKEIKWALTNGFDITKNEWYKVWNGDWDGKIRIEEDFVQTSVKEMIFNNVPFEKTSLYQFSVKKINNGQKRWSCLTEEEFFKRGQHILDIYKDIKENGFKTQEELNSSGKYSLKINNVFVDDPGVVLDKDGKMLYHNGNHRLAIVKTLDIPEIKIKINVRHKQWVDFLLYVKSVSESIWGENKIYQPVNHPDFSNYNCEWSNYRYELIKKYITKEDKTLLDIGALWGYFSSSFEKEELICTAVESNSTFTTIMNKLRIANDQRFNVIQKNVFCLDHYNYDIVLALNIFHHFLKTEDAYNNFKNMLQKLNTKTLFFQAHRQEEQQMMGAYKNYAPEEFLSFIINNSCLTNYVEIGEENSRKIYKLWKE